ncbi:MAG: toprim domain-containing protein [Verrucomicrobiales bacterium]|nr:toprim domain-containing protein [Verrucomicrobiales bacterium]
MARIPDEEITRIKKETDLAALIRSRGIELRKHGSKDLIGLCPFHDDTEPSMIVTPAKGLFHCMSCGAAGNAIQFVEKFDGVSFRHAFELLADGKAAFENTKAQRTKKATVPKLACPLDAEADDGALLDQVADYYHERLTQSKSALDYLASRGLDDEELVRRFRIGVADRTLGLRLPEKNRKEGAALRSRLQELGVYRESGHEHFNGSLVFPIVNGNDHVAEIYGRKITKGLRKGTPNHLYLPGPHHGIFNPDALEARELILCESILDALTFVKNGMENATCIYGTQGFTDELFEAIRAANFDAVRIAYDADDAGERAAKRDTERLQKIGVEVYRIRFPFGQDANGFAVAEGKAALRKLVRNAEWLGAGAPPSSTKIAAELAAEPAGSERAKEKRPEAPAVVELVRSGESHTLTLGDLSRERGGRVYQVRGLDKNHSLEVMKMTLRLMEPGGLFHLDQVDLCKDQDRRRFCERAGQECRLEPDLIKRDLGKLLLACEQAQEARLRAPEPEESTVIDLEPEAAAEALALLKSPNLIEKIGEAFDAAGIAGETTNKLAAYLAGTSRLLRKPLAVIIQSTSAAGKTTLMEAVLSFFPGEDQVKYSAMTGQSLYYLGEKNLKHKILAIVEEEGAEKASYALKLLQSEGELTIASTGKDATTGRMKTEEYHVEGPVAIVLTTTSIDIDEELMNRCLVLTVDESREQTERIHQLQREARTVKGIVASEKRRAILDTLTNAQRLLKPKLIANDFAPLLTFTSDRTRTRRDHEKYLTLIDTIALLHQHQREPIRKKVAGQLVEMIPVTVEDIEAANRIAPEVLGRSLDELPPQTRRLLDAIKDYVRTECERRKVDQDKLLFSRRELREETGWTQTQIRRHLDRLADLEYVVVRHGRNGIALQYELLVDADEKADGFAVGLLDPAKLRKK